MLPTGISLPFSAEIRLRRGGRKFSVGPFPLFPTFSNAEKKDRAGKMKRGGCRCIRPEKPRTRPHAFASPICPDEISLLPRQAQKERPVPAGATGFPFQQIERILNAPRPPAPSVRSRRPPGEPDRPLRAIPPRPAPAGVPPAQATAVARPPLPANRSDSRLEA